MIKSKFFQAEELYSGAWRVSNCFDDKTLFNTYAYLIEGSKKAVLIDTMFGYGNIAFFCRELTDKPVTLVNTHFHIDHIGGNFDFDMCYMHPEEIPWFVEDYNPRVISAEGKRQAMVNAALPEYKDKILDTDFSTPRPITLIPIWDGDVFDLGGRQLEVIQVAGHTPGEVVLLDRGARVCYTGDACNSNTLLYGPPSLSIEEYLENLRHFKKFQGAFDICHGGHEDFPPTVIDEGIELCGKILAGTDAREAGVNFGKPVLYAAHRDMERIRRGERYCNIAYNLDMVKKREKGPRII